MSTRYPAVIMQLDAISKILGWPRTHIYIFDWYFKACKLHIITKISDFIRGDRV